MENTKIIYIKYLKLSFIIIILSIIKLIFAIYSATDYEKERVVIDAFGIIVSLLTIYGIAKMNFKIIRIALIGNFLEAAMYTFSFAFILILYIFNNLNTLSIVTFLILLLMGIHAFIIDYITFNLYKIVKKYDITSINGSTTSVERNNSRQNEKTTQSNDVYINVKEPDLATSNQ